LQDFEIYFAKIITRYYFMFSNFTGDFFFRSQKKLRKKILLAFFKKHGENRVKKLKSFEK